MNSIRNESLKGGALGCSRVQNGCEGSNAGVYGIVVTIPYGHGARGVLEQQRECASSKIVAFLVQSTHGKVVRNVLLVTEKITFPVVRSNSLPSQVSSTTPS